LQIMAQLISDDYSAYLTTVRASLSDTFAKYERKFGSVRLHSSTIPGPSTGKKRTAWGKIFGSVVAVGLGAGNAGASPGAGNAGASPGAGLGAGSLSRMTSATALLQAASSTANLNSSELSAYLDSDTV
ncbi:hypothetical protein M2T53_27890, partial [Klebsiella pneumoniae]|nr:hypothetical protein [Klebsiella pneumoniae]